MSKVNGRIGSFVPAPAVIAPPRIVIAERQARFEFEQLMARSDADNAEAARAA
jgi:hypothetical protein